jgi:hypothetical protein
MSVDQGQQAALSMPSSTSWISGGEISIASPTEINISEGYGQIVDYTDPANPVIKSVVFGPFTNISITNIATQSATKISINLTAEIPTLIQSSVSKDAQLNRASVQLGLVAHPSATISNTFNVPLTERAPYQQLIDLIQCLGVINCGGFGLSPNADLTFNKSAGEITLPGSGIATGDVRENVSGFIAESPTTFSTRLGIQDVITASGVTDIDPANYDNGGGTPTAIGGGVGSSTIQYIYQAPIPEIGVIVMYGQTVYSTLDDAILNASNDVVTVPDIIKNNGLLIGRLAVTRVATDLSDSSQAVFFPGAKFGATISGGSSSSGTGGGDVLGPASSTVDNLCSFTDPSGKIIKDSGISTSSVITSPEFADSDFKIFDNSNPTRKAEFVADELSSAVTSYGLPQYSSQLELVRNQRTITTDRVLTAQDIGLNTIIFADVGLAGTINLSFPDLELSGSSNITVIIKGEGTLNIIPLGGTTFNGSGDTLMYSVNDGKELNFYHEGEESKTWTVENNLNERTYAFCKFNPNKTTNGEVSYRNIGIGFRVFRTGVGTFVIENDGTVLNNLPGNWAVESASGSESYIQVDAMIAGINGVTVTMETWGSANGANTGEPGTVTLFVRTSTGTLTDVANANGNINIKFIRV